jgi:hypothetical protein
MLVLNSFIMIFRVYPFGESATGWIARFSGRMAALQLIEKEKGMERPFRVVAPLVPKP